MALISAWLFSRRATQSSLPPLTAENRTGSPFYQNSNWESIWITGEVSYFIHCVHIGMALHKFTDNIDQTFRTGVTQRGLPILEQQISIRSSYARLYFTLSWILISIVRFSSRRRAVSACPPLIAASSAVMFFIPILFTLALPFNNRSTIAVWPEQTRQRININALSVICTTSTSPYQGCGIVLIAEIRWSTCIE